MKKIIVIAFASILSINAHAMPSANIYLDNLTILKLNNVQENHLRLSVPYPGKSISGNCNIVIRTRTGGDDDALKKLAEKLQFTHMNTPTKPDISNNSALVFALTPGMFVDDIDIETKDGKSIAENIASVFPLAEQKNNDVGVFTGVCA